MHGLLWLFGVDGYNVGSPVNAIANAPEMHGEAKVNENVGAREGTRTPPLSPRAAFSRQGSGTFQFHSSQYDALKRVVTIGGKYKIEKNKLSFTVEYTREIIGGAFKIADISSGSDSWSITGGQIKKIPLSKSIAQFATLQTGTKDKGVDMIEIDKVKYYKFDNDPDNFQ